MPATSSKVTGIFSESTRRARERPNDPSAPIGPPAAARRASSTKRPTISSVGPKPSSSSTSSDGVLLVEEALISTCFSASSADSWLSFQKAGISVEKSLVGVALLPGG